MGATENPDLGPDLFAICTMSFGSPTGTSDSGQSGASAQTMSVSVEERRRASRLGEEPAQGLVSRLGYFANINGEVLDKEATEYGGAFDSDALSGTLGVDLRVSGNWLVGIAGLLRKHDGDFARGGGFETTSTGGQLYASFASADALFLDLAAGYSARKHRVNRRAEFTEFDAGDNTRTYVGIVNSRTDGSELSAQLQSGYDFNAGRFTVGPRLGLQWSRTKIDDYSESGGGSAATADDEGNRGAAGLALAYDDQDVDSLLAVAGVQASMATTPGFGVLVVQGNLDYYRELEDDARLVGVRFVQDLRAEPTRFQYQTEAPVRDYFKAGLSFIAVLPGGVQPFVNLQAMFGTNRFSSYAATIGIRAER